MRRRVATIPLSYRLPNPPPVFLGREREMRQLAELLARCPFAAVAGPGGLGKTALALEVLSTRTPSVTQRALFVAIPPAEPLEQVCRTLLHALAALAGRADALDLPAIQGDFTLTLESILDLAEETQAWIVLDDVHHVIEGDVEELLLPLAAYARGTHVVVTSRRSFEAARLRELTVSLGKLSDDDVRAIAHALSAEPDALDAMVPLASGSPWILKQILARGRRGASEGLTTLLADLAPDDTELLLQLVLLRAEASPAVLDAILAGAPGEATDAKALQRLVARGLVQSSGGQTRVHDMVADLVGASMTPAARRAHGEALRERLAATDEPAVWLHAIRIALELGDAAGAMHLLGDRGEGILALGLAPRLFHVLSQTSHPASLTWRLRCAAELGNATALESVRRAHLEGPRDQLSWAHARHLEGEPRAAADLARELMSQGGEWARPARCLLARAELVDDHPERTIEALCVITRPSLEEAALLAQAQARLERPEALQTIEAALAACALDEPGPTIDAAEALAALDREGHALALLDEAARSPRGASPSHLVGRQGLLLRARLAAARGELTETERLLDRVRPFARGVSFVRVRLVMLDVRRRLALGACEGLTEVLAQCLASARVADASSVAALEALAARTARVGRGKSWWTVPSSDPLEACARSLARGDVAQAEDEGRAALAQARGPLEELEALSVLADISLVAGAHTAHRERVARLAALADQIDSPRFRLEASFHEEHHDLAAMERLAQHAATSASTAMRARALLGMGLAMLDPGDARVVARVTERLGAVEQLVAPASDEWTAGWGLHVERCAVWLSDGRWLSLERKPVLWALLLLVADARGAEVDKETLVLRVWNERTYHPGLHDAKLHVAVRALRKELEEVPAHPARFLTTRGGYCLGGPCRRLG